MLWVRLRSSGQRYQSIVYFAPMAQTRAGAIEIAAKKIGVSVHDYKAKIRARQKWCFRGRHWAPISLFCKDKTRYDGLAAACSTCRNAKSREVYKPKPKLPKGRSIVPARDGDRLQARRRINYFVEAGIIPNPNSLPCVDCGHIGKDRRHEYDHYLGYAAEHHEHVQPTCSRCHAAREKVIRGNSR